MNRTSLAAFGSVALFSAVASSAPPPPSGPHPRIFLGKPGVLDALKKQAGDSSSSAAGVIGKCQAVVDSPDEHRGRDAWPTAIDCAFAWQLTKKAAYAKAGIALWNHLLRDRDDDGDNLACIPGASSEQAIASVRSDDGFAISYIGQSAALAYDWLHDAPGVDASLLELSRSCFGEWIDWYTKEGYHNEQPGANYHAKYVLAKVYVAVGEAGEDGDRSDGYWKHVVDEIYGKQIVGEGLAGRNDPVGKWAGALVGGDWAEGWQYGEYSVLSYALGARALEDHGAVMPEVDAWASSLALRHFHAQTPNKKGSYVGGDYEGDGFDIASSRVTLNAILAGPSTNEAAAFAQKEHQALGNPRGDEASFYDALADLRDVAPKGFDSQPLSYLARGTRNLYVRSSWDKSAYFSVFTSAPRVVDDHQHFDATNFVFTRGSDDLIVDPSPYGSRSSLTSNALTCDSKNVTGDYAPSQTPWSRAELLWARSGKPGVVAARGDFAKAFIFTETPSDIPFARRDWVFLPEGEIVTIDRTRTNSSGKKTYLRLRTPARLALEVKDGAFFADGTVGSSRVAIHGVVTSDAAPSTKTVADGDCFEDSSFGDCADTRVTGVHQYTLTMEGPEATAVHVIDGLAKSEDTADVGSLNDPPYDTDKPENEQVVGAAVWRGKKQTFVVASSAKDGDAGHALVYGVPAKNPSRHVVFDAPEDGDGKSNVKAVAAGDRCRLTITAGGAFTGRPLMITVTSAADGCKVTDDPDVPKGTVSPGPGVPRHPAVLPDDEEDKGCGCTVVGHAGPSAEALSVVALAFAAAVRKRRERPNAGSR